jgi:orotate phosphoribosyltransferase
MVDDIIFDMFNKDIAKYKDNPPFTLTSGRKSPWYFDIKSAIMDGSIVGSIRYYIDNLYYERQIDDFDRIGGVANGGYSMVTLAMLSNAGIRQQNAFVYRKKPKGHGLQNQIDGHGVLNNEKVLLLEDVITTGGSLMPVIKYVEECGASVSQIFCVVNRIEEPHPEFKQYEEKVISMITLEQAKKVYDKNVKKR